MINVKAPSGTRIELTNDYIARVEDDIRAVVRARRSGMIVSNIGVNADLSAIYTTNSAMHTAFVQVQSEGRTQDQQLRLHRSRATEARAGLPELSTFFQTGGLVDSIVNQGMPAPIDIQVTGNNQHAATMSPARWRRSCASCTDVSDVLIPQDLDYPGIQLNVKREMAARLGLTARMWWTM